MCPGSGDSDGDGSDDGADSTGGGASTGPSSGDHPGLSEDTVSTGMANSGFSGAVEGTSPEGATDNESMDPISMAEVENSLSDLSVDFTEKGLTSGIVGLAASVMNLPMGIGYLTGLALEPEHDALFGYNKDTIGTLGPGGYVSNPTNMDNALASLGEPPGTNTNTDEDGGDAHKPLANVTSAKRRINNSQELLVAEADEGTDRKIRRRHSSLTRGFRFR
jgi:hypothetical protein